MFCFAYFFVSGDIGNGFRNTLEYFIVGNDSGVLLARSRGGVVGILVRSYQMNLDREGKTAKIEALIIDEKHRRERVGKQLANYFSVLAKEQECRAIKSRINRKNKKAQKFHESLGFIRADTYEYMLDFLTRHNKCRLTVDCPSSFSLK